LSFININWYISLAFCLIFFISGRQLADVQGGSPRTRGTVGLILLFLAVPSLLFPFAYIPGAFAASAWYNTFRSINRIELFSSLIAPAVGYATYRNPDSAYGAYRTSAQAPFARAIKPLAFPFCVLLISVNFIGPVVRPLDKASEFNDLWVDNGVYIQSIGPSGGPAALISAMHGINSYVDDEYNAVKGTYTDRAGTEFWYLARYALNRGYRTKFIKPQSVEDAPVPSVVRVSRLPADDDGPDYTDGADSVTRRSRPNTYIALLKRSGNGTITVGDPLEGRLALDPGEFKSLYGDPDLALALSAPRY